MKPFLPTLALLVLVACDPAGSLNREGSVLPSFETKLSVLRELAAMVTEPSSLRKEELGELFDTAYVLGVGARLAMQAERLLAAAKDRTWVLEQALEHERPQVRAKAAFELGRCGQPAAILPLLKRVKYEADPMVRVWLAVALATLGNHSALTVLILAMDDEFTAVDAGVQAMAICEANGQQLGAEPSYEELQLALGVLRDRWQSTGRVLGKEVSDAEVNARIAVMLVQLEGFQLRPVDDARFVLSRAGSLGLPLLSMALQAKEVYLRVHALEIVGDLGVAADSLADQVRPLLDDPLSRTFAVRAVGEMQFKKVLPRLLSMSFSADLELRTAVALGLGPLGDRRAMPRLEELFADNTEAMDVRVAAAFSLALFEAERPAYKFLLERRAQGDFHPPTIEELIQRVDSLR